MAVNTTHPDYDAAALEWSRARDVLAGEDAVKGGGEKYLPRLDSQTDEEFAAYVKRASYFNASARTSEAYLGLMFRRPPFVKLPDQPGAGDPKSEGRNPKAYESGIGKAMAEFQNDADMLGTTLTGYAKMVVGDGHQRWHELEAGRDWRECHLSASRTGQYERFASNHSAGAASAAACRGTGGRQACGGAGEGPGCADSSGADREVE